ncbi:hypothetical protein DV735_g2382, partial [Chaetothyriales sp. CBS 134920]
MNSYDHSHSSSLAPLRSVSLRTRPRPVTASGLPLSHDGSCQTRYARSRLSLGPERESDIVDWRSSFVSTYEVAEPALAPSHELYRSSTDADAEAAFMPHGRRPHQRRASHLGQTLRNSFNDMRSLGRRLSLSVRGRSTRQKEEMQDSKWPHFQLLRPEDKMMDFHEAVSSKPRPRPWRRTPSTRRRPSLPLLSFNNADPWHTSALDRVDVRDLPPDPALPRSRGQPVLTDLVYGGAGARAAAAAHNELYDAARTTPLPPYEATERKFSPIRDSESGIGISLEARSRTSSVASVPKQSFRDPTVVLVIELQEAIFKLLDIDALRRASLVSHRWRQVCESQAVWREVFLRKYAVQQASSFLRSRRAPGLGRNVPGQDYKKLAKIRTLIDQRWERGEAAAIYLNGHRDSVYCVQFDEHKIITGSRDNTIRIWDAHTYQCIKKLGPPNNPREGPMMEKAAVEPSGVVPFFKADVSSPDLVAGPLPHWHQASVLCLQYDDEILVTGSSDFTCLVWSIKDNYLPVLRLIGHQAGVLDVCIDARHIITCSKDTTIKVWNRSTGELLRTLRGHKGPVNAVQVRGKLLASASGDGMSKLWRVEDGVCIKEFQSKDRGLACIEFSEDGRTIFAGGNDKVIYEYDTVTGRRVRELKGHTDLVRSLHLDWGNSRIISGSYDHSIKVWDAREGETADDGGLKINFQGWTSSWMLAAKSNYRKIVCTSQDGRVVIIDFGYGIEGVEAVEA